MILSNLILLTGIAATAIAPAYGSLTPRSLGEPEVVAGHGRNLSHRARCDNGSECPSGLCGTWGYCKKKNKDCKKDDLDWKCSTGTSNPTPKECVLKLNKAGNPKKWGKCRSIPTMTEVVTQYDKHEGHYISSQGLVNIDGDFAKVGSFNSGKFDFSYDQFQLACTRKCSRTFKCNAVSVVKWKLPANEFDVRFNPPFGALSGKKYFHCDLFDTTVKVNGVAAAQMGPAPRGHVDDAEPAKVLTSRDNVVYAKKEVVIEEYKACAARMISYSIACTLCMVLASDDGASDNDANDYCTRTLGLTDFACKDLVGLLSDTDDELPELNRDFRSKVWPAAECVFAEGGNQAAIGSCFACLAQAQALYGENKADRQVSVAKAICSKTDDINFLRGTCKDECYFEQCQADLETAMLCATGIPLGVTKDVGKCTVLDFTGYPYEGGAINTPYTCPQDEE